MVQFHCLVLLPSPSSLPDELNGILKVLSTFCRAFQSTARADCQVGGSSLQHPVWTALVRGSDWPPGNRYHFEWLTCPFSLFPLHLSVPNFKSTCMFLIMPWAYKFPAICNDLVLQCSSNGPVVNAGMGRRAVHKAMFESVALVGASLLQIYLLQRLFERKLGTSRV